MKRIICCVIGLCLALGLATPAQALSLSAASACLLDCDRTERNEKGDYIATVEDSSILNAKVMIWDG